MFIRKRTTVWHHWLALIENRAGACGIFFSMSFHGSPVDPYVSIALAIVGPLRKGTVRDSLSKERIWPRYPLAASIAWVMKKVDPSRAGVEISSGI